MYFLTNHTWYISDTYHFLYFNFIFLSRRVAEGTVLPADSPIGRDRFDEDVVSDDGDAEGSDAVAEDVVVHGR